MFNLLIETNSIRLKEIARLILDILNGSLKIDSSIIGRSNEYFSRIYTLKLISFCSGNSPKYLKGVDINNPTIISLAEISNDSKVILKMLKRCNIIIALNASGLF